MPKVLVIEDDIFLANAYKIKLTKEGFTVAIARDGEEGIAALTADRPDVILLDLIMPKKDGFETLAEIKGNENFKDIPVIVASNLGQKADLDKAQQLGAQDYIVKSDMSLDVIIEKVKALIPQAPPVAAAA
jgi:DNA-binding response OmpR family regulator